MNDTVKNLINKTIEREFYRITESAAELKRFEDYKELDSKNGEIQDKIFETIPEEYHDLINELIESFALLSGTESKFAFKQGVIKGLVDLNYLNDDIGQKIEFI